MSTDETNAAGTDPHAAQLRLARWLGTLAMGLALGVALLPALLELLSLVGDIKAFRYQNF